MHSVLISASRSWPPGAQAARPAAVLPPQRLRAAAAAGLGRQQQRRRPPFSRRHATHANGSASDSGSDSEQPETVPHIDKRRKPVPLRPELAGELAPLAVQCGLGSGSLPALARKVAALGPKREQGVVQHGQRVASCLQQLGMQQEQLVELLLDCPLLFSWPAEQRAAVLVEQQLMGRLGLKAAEAADCFRQQPAAAGSLSFEPAIEALLPLFAAASSSKGSSAAPANSEAALSEAERQAAERALGQLLRQLPAAVNTLKADAATLRQSLSMLQQSYGLGAEQVVKALKQSSGLLSVDLATSLPALEAALQQELPGIDGRQLVGAMLVGPARAISCGEEKMRRRCRALLAPGAFTAEQLQGLEPGPLARLLGVNTAVWQLALAVWAKLGVADPRALALGNMRSVSRNWLEPGQPPARLVNLLALQRYGPVLAEEQQQQQQQHPAAEPSAASVVQNFAGYMIDCSPNRLSSRLLFLQQEGLSHLLVASKEEWRRQRGLRPGKSSPSEPPLIALGADVSSKSDPEFCALPALRSDGQQQQQDGRLAAASGSPADRYGAFMAALGTHPPYQQLQAAAAELQEQLLRDPEVARLASGLGQRRRKKSRR